MVGQFQRLIAPYLRMARMMVARGVINLVKDDLKAQEVQVTLLADEVRADLERFQEYGFTSHPHQRAECVAVFVGGNRDHGIVIAVEDRRYRLKSLAQGEVAIYDDQGQAVHLKRDKVIHVYGCNEVQVDAEVKAVVTAPEIDANAATKCTVTSPDVTVTAATSVQVASPSIILGSQGATYALVDQRLLDLYNAHTHGQDGTPSVKLTADGVCTSIAQAG